MKSKTAIDLLVKVADGFLLLNKAAADLRDGQQTDVDLTDGGEVAQIEREARAVESADPTFPECIPHPYRQLPIMRGVLVDLGKWLQKSDCPEVWRGLASSYVEQTALLRDVIGMRLFGLADLAAAKVKIAELNVKLASTAEERDKAEKALAEAKNDLAKARDILALLEALQRGQEALQRDVKEVGDRVERKVDDALEAYRTARAEAVGRVFEALLKGRELKAEEAELLVVIRDAWGRGENITTEEAGARLKRKRGKHWVSVHYHKLVGAGTGWGFQSAAAAVKSASPYNERR